MHWTSQNHSKFAFWMPLQAHTPFNCRNYQIDEVILEQNGPKYLARRFVLHAFWEGLEMEVETSIDTALRHLGS